MDSRWKCVILSVRLLTVFKEKKFRDRHWTWVCLPNQCRWCCFCYCFLFVCLFVFNVHALLFLTRSVIVNCALCLQYRYSRPWANILRCAMFKRTCIHSPTSVNTPCNLWQGKIPLVRLSQSQRARQKLWNVQFPSLFFQLQAMQKRENPRVIIFFRNICPRFCHGHYVQLLIHA